MKIYSYLDSGYRRARHPASDPHSGARRPVGLPGRPRAGAVGAGLAALLSDPALRQRLASHAKQYVQEEFTPEAARRKLASFYSAMEAKAAEARA